MVTCLHAYNHADVAECRNPTTFRIMEAQSDETSWLYSSPDVQIFCQGRAHLGFMLDGARLITIRVEMMLEK